MTALHGDRARAVDGVRDILHDRHAIRHRGGRRPLGRGRQVPQRAHGLKAPGGSLLVAVRRARARD